MKVKNLKNNEVEIKHPIEKSIVKHISEYKKCVFGDLVKELAVPYHDLLKHVLELKNKGVIVKETNGYFTLPTTAKTGE